MKDHIYYFVFDADIMAHTIGRGSTQGSRQPGDRGVERGSSSMHSDTHPDAIEGSDGEDESTFHDAPARRGPASQVQVPEPMNREWIWIEDGE
jgi:hypothetical protein